MFDINLIEEVCEIEKGLSFIKESPARELKEIYGETVLPQHCFICILKDSTPESELWIAVLTGILATFRRYKLDINQLSLSPRCQWPQLKAGLDLYKRMENLSDSPEQLASAIENFSDLLPSGHFAARRAFKFLATYYRQVIPDISRHYLYTPENVALKSSVALLLSELEKTQSSAAQDFLAPVTKKLRKLAEITSEFQSHEEYLYDLSTYCLWLAERSISEENYTSALVFLHRACDTLMQNFSVLAGIIKLVDKKPKFIDKSKEEHTFYLKDALDLLPKSQNKPFIFKADDIDRIREINKLRNDCLMAHGDRGANSEYIINLVEETKDLITRITGDRKWSISSTIFTPINFSGFDRLLLDPSCAIPSYFKNGTAECRPSFKWSSVS